MKLTDACARLLTTQQRLTQQLHAAGLITDRAAAALHAREDQLDAAIADLRTHRRDPDPDEEHVDAANLGANSTATDRPGHRTTAPSVLPAQATTDPPHTT